MYKHPDFQLSVDARALAQRLAEVAEGGNITYTELSTIIGRSVQGVGRDALNSARIVVQREKRIIFETVRGVGLKRLENAEIVDLSDKSREHVRRHARRTVKKLVCVNYDHLPKDKQTKHNAAISMMGILSEMTTEKSQMRLESKVRDTGESLPAARAAIEALGI